LGEKKKLWLMSPIPVSDLVVVIELQRQADQGRHRILRFLCEFFGSIRQRRRCREKSRPDCRQVTSQRTASFHRNSLFAPGVRRGHPDLPVMMPQAWRTLLGSRPRLSGDRRG
jgi:hypothetical protein